MKFVKAAAIREAEQQAIQANPPLAAEMMGRAGEGLARWVHFISLQAGITDRRVRLLAGPGNNGGDLFAAALMLEDVFFTPEVWLACSVERLQGASKYYFERLCDYGIPWREMVNEGDWPLDATEPNAPPIFVDGLLGTGAQGAPTGVIRRAIDYLNAQSQVSLIVSADVPSGMDADTGAAAGAVVRADFTVTMGFPKAGMAAPAGWAALGSLSSVDIDLPREAAAQIPDGAPGIRWISEATVRDILPRREAAAHKGALGCVQLAGGSAQYPGAMVLTAEGATRSGVGLVQVTTAPASAAAIAARMPEVIVHGDYSADWPMNSKATALVVGPGLGRDPEARRFIARLLRETTCPLVLDADAIGVLEGRPDVVRSCSQPVVLTPHPGELAELLGQDVDAIQSDRQKFAMMAAEQTGAVVVLKGAGTMIAQEGQATWLNLNGNPGMACGGSGDVLAGLLGGLLAQGIPPVAAACAAVWLHGMAGDMAALQHTQAAMNARDIAVALPGAFKRVAVR